MSRNQTIEVGNVEGRTNRKGAKQNRKYSIIEKSESKNWYACENSQASIWNVNGDWSEIGIQAVPFGRVSYTTDFKIFSNLLKTV